MEPSSASDRLLRLLMIVGEHSAQGGARSSELIRSSGLTKPTVHRLLGELRRYDLVEQDPVTSQYRLGPKILTLAAQSLGGRDLRRVAHPVMTTLSAELGHTIHLGVRDGEDIVYVDKVDPPTGLHLASSVGMRRPLSVTAMGKALVAALSGSPNTYAIDDQESDPGFRCAGAAIFDHVGRPVAALSATGPTTNFRKSQFGVVGDKVLRAAKDISQAMGFRE